MMLYICFDAEYIGIINHADIYILVELLLTISDNETVSLKRDWLPLLLNNSDG